MMNIILPILAKIVGNNLKFRLSDLNSNLK